MIRRTARPARSGCRGSPVYRFRSLLKFKAKFQPVYEPMYMCYPETAALTRIGLGISHAYLPNLTVRQTVRMVGELT